MEREISGPWQFREAGTGDWLPATVPGTVHTDLLANKKIPDPFYRTNERDLQWIDKKDWEYQTTFDMDAATLAQRHIELCFAGLDTYCRSLPQRRADPASATICSAAGPPTSSRMSNSGANLLARAVLRSPIRKA